MEREDLYQFGPFRLHAVGRVLLRGGRLVPLPAKALSTLLVLVRNSKRLVEKDALIQEVWPDEIVEEGNLAQHIHVLRKALRETAEGRKYIETIPRRGYRFLETVIKIDDPTTGVTTGVRGQCGDAQVSRPYSLAVLPFVNASGDTTLGHVADNLTENIINSLSRVPEFYVAARTSVSPYRGMEIDPRQVGHELGVRNVLLGRVQLMGGAVEIRTELIDVDGGWQLYGKTHACQAAAVWEAHDVIASELSGALRLRLGQEQERRISKRHTENSEAYQAYLKGRYYWSKYTAEGLVEATRWFEHTIDLDPSFALAYAAIVDCYLRLATNYIPPADDPPKTTAGLGPLEFDEGNQRARALLNVRREWDTKSTERECRRATELKSNYPAAHQWHAAYLFARGLYEDRAGMSVPGGTGRAPGDPIRPSDAMLLDNIQASRPTADEEVQVFCTVAREQIEAGNYEAACLALQRWWALGGWPKLDGLSPHMSADLLFTVGSLACNVVSTRQVPKGQKHAEALLNGSIALFEQLNAKTRSAEGRIELALCYQREGLFDLARTALLAALGELSDKDRELESLCLMRLASLTRSAGRPHDALARLSEASEIVELAGPWVTGRHLLELASSLKDLATAENRTEYLDRALEHYLEALYQFEAVGHHRLAAIAENNYGYLLLNLNRLDEAHGHLARARKLFDGFGDKVRCAQVDETMAQYHLAAQQFEVAEQVIKRSVETLEIGGEDAILAESLRTQGVVLCKLGRYREAQRVLERAQQVAEHCGDMDGAKRAVRIKTEVVEQLSQELQSSQQRLLALEKRATEGSMADGIAHEMHKVLANSKVMLDQVLGLGGPEPDIGLGTANCRALIEIYEGLEAVLDKDKLQTVRARMQTILANEERQNTLLQLVRAATERGLAMTLHVMEYAELERRQLGQGVVNINELILRIINELREEFRGQGDGFVYKPGGPAVCVTGNETQLYWAVKNLVLNAGMR